MKYLLILFLSPFAGNSQQIKEFRLLKRPPDQTMVMNWYMDVFPTNYNGWKVIPEQQFRIGGRTEGAVLTKLSVTCDTCDFINKYTFDIIFKYGYDGETSLTVKQNKDTTAKYLKEPKIYPL